MVPSSPWTGRPRGRSSAGPAAEDRRTPKSKITALFGLSISHPVFTHQRDVFSRGRAPGKPALHLAPAAHIVSQTHLACAAIGGHLPDGGPQARAEDRPA